MTSSPPPPRRPTSPPVWENDDRGSCRSLPVSKSLSLWERWHCVSNDGEGKPPASEPLHSDKHWLLSERCYLCVFCFSIASLPSQALTRQLPQRGSLRGEGKRHLYNPKKPPARCGTCRGSCIWRGAGSCGTPPPGLVSLSPVRCGLPLPAAGWALRPHGG